MIHFFYVETAFVEAACLRTTPPPFELRTAEEGRMYKMWDLVYKVVQNEYKITIQFFMFKLHLGEGGLQVSNPSPKFELRIAEEGRMYKVGDLVCKIIQNEYKIMIQFLMLKLHLGGLYVSNPPPKFELRIAEEGRVCKIWDLVYKIVQKEYKIMIQFFMLKLHFKVLHVSNLPPKFELRITAGGRVYKIWDSVYKIVQNEYKIMI